MGRRRTPSDRRDRGERRVVVHTNLVGLRRPGVGRGLVLLVAVSVLALVGVPERQAQAEVRACSTTTTAGGDWPMYGRDLANSRTQVAESSLSPLRAITLSPVWRYDTGPPPTGLRFTDINATPI